MIIEIQGIGFPNQGAELMLAAVARRLEARFGDRVAPVCRPNLKSRDSAIKMARYGVAPLLEVSRQNIPLGGCLNLVPSKMTRAFNLYRRKDVDLVLDTSGLLFSDDWGLDVMRRGAARLQAQLKRGVPLVFMPQAFGPFKTAESRKVVRPLFRKAEAVFCRDRRSLEHARSVDPGENLYLCPDLTIAHHPRAPGLQSIFAGQVVFIPNKRMLDRTDPEVGKRYLAFFQSLMQGVRDAGEDIVLMNHEGDKDLELCRELQEGLGLDTIHGWPDAEKNKVALGGAKAVVSSRFHGVVSALSQEVPAFCTSWNHKYEELARSFAFPESVLSLEVQPDLQRILSVLQDPIVYDAARDKLRESRERLETEIESMWDRVYHIMEGKLGLSAS
ncbi:MAG: polysaccharide pyruvyl transferase family protein [Verrucomicrobia bacterium]|nr:polysaccharide pyruvyl transferase family protein [Verrucomicrobiota bacterium]MCH8511791.1 polysaccharide pyruvyl transferase family protein [Kiritimatiellia bacterium]